MQGFDRSGAWGRVAACVAVLFTGTVLIRAAVDTVRTDVGSVTAGPAAGGVTAFLGVPFAAPPVGTFRWRAPQPHEPRNGDWKADKFAPSCMQSQPGSRLPWTEEIQTKRPSGEDG